MFFFKVQIVLKYLIIIKRRLANKNDALKPIFIDLI